MEPETSNQPEVKEERVNYIIDTSVLAFHGEAVHSFPGHNLYIPIEVLEELDDLKSRMDQVGSACRYVNRYLDEARECGSLNDGVLLTNQQKIFATNIANLEVLPAGMKDCVDNRIISVAFQFIKSGKNAVIVSRDISFRIKCDALGIPAITYEKNSQTRDQDSFDNLLTVEIQKSEIDQFYQNGFVNLENQKFFPNQGLILRSGQASALALASSKTQARKLSFAGEKSFSLQGFSPRSKEQTLALELLLDPDIDLVSLSGKAGSGKTFLTCLAALELIHQKEYKKLIISRPNQSTSKDIGFLPGSLEEKLSPWMQPFFDNIEIILGNRGQSYIDMMFEKGVIQMEALAYVRGRTLPNTIFVIDEAQNISHHEAKAVLTRMGEGSKIILLGDLEQIDSPHLDQSTSGLNSVVNLFKDFEKAGHVSLKKGERSELASYAAKVM